MPRRDNVALHFNSVIMTFRALLGARILQYCPSVTDDLSIREFGIKLRAHRGLIPEKYHVRKFYSIRYVLKNRPPGILY